MTSHPASAEWLQKLYGVEQSLGGALAPFGVQFSPIAVTGDVADPGLYNLPYQLPVTTQAVTYAAAGTPVSDTYTGVSLWNLSDDAGGVSVAAAKNDILSKHVIATGADGYKAAFSLGEIDPQFGNQPVLVAYSDTAGSSARAAVTGWRASSSLVTMRAVATFPTSSISTSAVFPSPDRLERAASPISSP